MKKNSQENKQDNSPNFNRIHGLICKSSPLNEDQNNDEIAADCTFIVTALRSILTVDGIMNNNLWEDKYKLNRKGICGLEVMDLENNQIILGYNIKGQLFYSDYTIGSEENLKGLIIRTMISDYKYRKEYQIQHPHRNEVNLKEWIDKVEKYLDKGFVCLDRKSPDGSDFQPLQNTLRRIVGKYMPKKLIDEPNHSPKPKSYKSSINLNSQKNSL